MTTRLAHALQRYRQLKGARVLCQKDGQPLRANMLAYRLERATRRAGLPTGHKPRHAGPHLLRHTFCSHLSMRGAPARAMQKLAGHRDLGTTQRYMHLSPLASKPRFDCWNCRLPPQSGAACRQRPKLERR
jgi:site-specific recombinase XerD